MRWNKKNVKKAKAFLGGIKKYARKKGKQFKEYQAKAPERRKEEISKLRQEITIERERATLRKLRQPQGEMGLGSMGVSMYAPKKKKGKGYDPFGGF